MTERFERHRQPWRQDEIQKLHLLAGKGMRLRAIAKALTRSEELVQVRARADKLKISKLRVGSAFDPLRAWVGIFTPIGAGSPAR